MTDAVTLAGIDFSYPGAPGPALVIDTFAVAERERVLLVGASGSGKSTLLNLVCGTLLCGPRQVRVLGEDMAAMRSGARDRFRASRLGVIFQQFNLVPYLSVLDNVLLPVRLSGARTDAFTARALELLDALGVDTGLGARPASTLSVGQQQRVAAARAFLLEPGLVIADEPTSALDADRREDFLALMFAQAARTGAALLVVSHDESMGARFDRVVRLDPPAMAVAS